MGPNYTKSHKNSLACSVVYSSFMLKINLGHVNEFYCIRSYLTKWSLPNLVSNPIWIFGTMKIVRFIGVDKFGGYYYNGVESFLNLDISFSFTVIFFIVNYTFGKINWKFWLYFVIDMNFLYNHFKNHSNFKLLPKFMKNS